MVGSTLKSAVRFRLVMALAATAIAAFAAFGFLLPTPTALADADDICGYAYLYGDKSGSYNLVIQKDRKRDARGYVDLGPVKSSGYAWDEVKPWSEQRDGILSVSIQGGVQPEKMTCWFRSATILQTVDFSGLDASMLTDTSELFELCTMITDIDLPGCDTPRLAKTNSMFNGCTALKSISLSGWDMSNVVDMGSMFRDCHSLETIDLPSSRATSAVDMSYMFAGCRALKSLEAPRLDSGDGASMFEMFDDCWSLEHLDLSQINTSQVTDMSSLFAGCHALKDLDLSHFDTSQVTDMSMMFLGCASLTLLDLSSFDTSSIKEGVRAGTYEALDGLSGIQTLTLSPTALFANFPEGYWRLPDDGFVHKNPSRVVPTEVTTYTRLAPVDASVFITIDAAGQFTISGEFPGEDTQDAFFGFTKKTQFNSAEECPWHDMRNEITSVRMEGDGVSCYGGTAHWFEDCESLVSVDLSELDTTDSKDYSCTFRNCHSLETIDISSMNTVKATSMKRMFHGCDSLRQVKLGTYFSFRGSSDGRLPGSELPSGAWQAEGDAGHAYASDSIPHYANATFNKVDETTVGLTIESLRGDTVTGNAKYTVESTIVEGEDGQLEELIDYRVSDTYASDTFAVGSTAKASSSKTLTAQTVTKQTLNSIGAGNSKVTQVIVGTQVKSITAGAFSDSPKVVLVRVKSSHLHTKPSMHNCLQGSSVRKVVVGGTMSKAAANKVANAFRKWSGLKVKK